jgi:hypothetical protein
MEIPLLALIWHAENQQLPTFGSAATNPTLVFATICAWHAACIPTCTGSVNDASH